YKPLLMVLLQKPNVSLWLSQAPKLLSTVNPLRLLREGLQGEGAQACFEQGELGIDATSRRGLTRANPLPASSFGKDGHFCFVHQRASILDEVAYAFSLAKRYSEEGCP